MPLSHALLLLLLLGLAPLTRAQDAAPAPSSLVSGIERGNFDPAVRPQDDLFGHVNGAWIARTEIPADRASYGPAQQLQDRTLEQLRAIVENAAAGRDAPPDSDEQRIGDLYASYMDEDRLERLRLTPLEPALQRVSSLRSKREIAELMADLGRIGVGTPIDIDIDQDARRSNVYAVTLYQSGLGLPDRDYYLLQDDAKYGPVRKAYLGHVERMLALAGESSADAATHAREIVALETRLARLQWTRTASRDPVKTYNKVTIASLPRALPGFDWRAWLHKMGLADRIEYVVVAQPSYLRGLAGVIDQTPLATWKAYFRWHLLHTYGRYLDKSFVDETYAFENQALRGVPEVAPRWKRGVALVNSAIGFGLGKLYVEQHFPPASKARMERLVANLREAFGQRIDALDWMGPATRREAHAKLAKMTTKIAYPDQWRDYSRLIVRRDDLVGNVLRASVFELQRNVAKLGKPIDRSEWFMTPQTVNAYYNPGMNEIVFPAAYLQAPYFDPGADDAANYGAVGSTIGHEMSHAFDDTGARFDGEGNLRNWWSRADHARFARKTKALVAQFDSFEALPGYGVNGALTLGENIADLSGLEVALQAYRLSLGTATAPVIDGMTGEQRFFLSYAQSWRDKTRPEETLMLLKADEHAPEKYRCNGSVRNVDGFYTAFDVKPADAMYLAPEKRVRLW